MVDILLIMFYILLLMVDILLFIVENFIFLVEIWRKKNELFGVRSKFYVENFLLIFGEEIVNFWWTI